MEDYIGFNIQEVAKAQPLTNEEEFWLFGRLRDIESKIEREDDDDQALEKERQEIVTEILVHNIPFSVQVAKEMSKGSSEPLEDLISYCNIGMLNAIQTFDRSTGYRFITYAVWRMKEQVFMALAKERDTSSYFFNLVGKAYKKLNKNPQGGKGGESFFDVQDVLKDVGIKNNLIESYEFVSGQHIPLDSPVGDDSNQTVGEVIPCQNPTAQEAIEREEMAQVILEEIESILREKQAYIVKSYFGIGDNEPTSLRVIADGIGYSRQGVERVLNNSLKLLSESELLADYFNDIKISK